MSELRPEAEGRGGGPGRAESRRASSRRRPRSRHSRIRTLYFAIASLWGFLIGSAVILGGLSLAGRPVDVSPGVSGLLLVAALLAVGGGVVTSLAYREAAGRAPRRR